MRLKRRVIDEATDPRLLPDMLIKTLNNLDGEALVLAPGEFPVFESQGIERLGILKDGRIDSPELLATIRVVRRTNTKHTGRIDVPRGPIGEGIHELTVNVFLLLGPHRGRVTLVIPHGVAEEGIQEDIGLVHVAIHALAGGNGAGEDVLQRVALFLLLPVESQRIVVALARPRSIAMVIMTGLLHSPVAALLLFAVTRSVFDLARNRRIGGDRLPVAAILRIGQRMARFAVVGVDHVARGAA